MNVANVGTVFGKTSLPESPGAQDVHRPSEAEVVLRATDIRRSFGGTVVLDRVSAELRRGEVVLLRGDNGSGKTTLLNILTGSLTPDSGTIDVMLPSGHEHFSFPKRWTQVLNLADNFTPERVAKSGVSRTWQEIRLFFLSEPTRQYRDRDS